jgi:mycoredoxin
MELVTVYRRPGCPYCAGLRQDLRLLGVPAREVDIWADESGAATVRELADGSETVPTVVIGGRGYVNLSAATVLAEARRISPGFAPDQNLARTGGGCVASSSGRSSAAWSPRASRWKPPGMPR